MLRTFAPGFGEAVSRPSFIKNTSHVRLMSAIWREPFSVKRLATRVGVTERRIRQMLKPLFEAGSVYKTFDKPPKYGSSAK